MLLFSPRPLPSLEDAWSLLKTGTLWAGKTGYAKSNPLESGRVDAYALGGPIPSPPPTTATGRALTALIARERGDLLDG